ncbi:MAG: glutamate 5-kinase [Candidatus Caldarchaeum sp.]
MSGEDRAKLIRAAKRVVIKIGSSILTSSDMDINEDSFRSIAREVSALRTRGIEPVIVSSGAIAAGMKKLGLRQKPRGLAMKQAIAACGQSALMWYYEKAFSEYGEKVAQILITHDGLAIRKRFLYAQKTVLTLLRMGVIPIVNENDTVAVEEIMLGDNDNLAALVTSLTHADLLIMLTDIDGFYDKDPRLHPDAKIIPVIEKITPDVEKLAGGTMGRTTTGGMKTKIEAARTAAAFGVPTIIANGKKDTTITDIFSDKDVGTLFVPEKSRLKGRKHWIAYTLRPSGTLVVDSGAKAALIKAGKSLLPSGVKAVYGKFEVGELVRCVDEGGYEIARGLSSYSSDEIKKILGSKSCDIESLLGYKYRDEIIHRDDLVVLADLATSEKG